MSDLDELFVEHCGLALAKKKTKQKNNSYNYGQYD